MAVTILIFRPTLGLELIHFDAAGNTIIFPDGNSVACSDFPHSGVSVLCKKRGHVVFSSQTKVSGCGLESACEWADNLCRNDGSYPRRAPQNSAWSFSVPNGKDAWPLYFKHVKRFYRARASLPPGPCRTTAGIVARAAWIRCPRSEEVNPTVCPGSDP